MDTNLLNLKFQPHLTLPENTLGKDFVVSDLHGHRSELDGLLKKLNFNESQDRLISVGDLIDRGDNSPGCLSLLEEPWFWAVRGNHEQMLIDTIRDQTDSLWSRWLVNGGSWVLEQPDIQLEDWAKHLKYLPYTITLPIKNKTIGICHAEYSENSWEDRLSADEVAQSQWLWGRTKLKAKDTRIIKDVDWVFCGHTIVEDVTTLGNTAFIERGAYLHNPLTVIDLQHWLLGR